VSGEPKLLLDEMLSGEIAVQLRAKGHDVVAVVEELALLATPDEELLAHAGATGRILVTINVRDFARINAAWASTGRGHAGLIYVTNQAFPRRPSHLGAIVTALDELITSGQLRHGGEETYLRRLRPS
jgi:uncharacterized protein with PIN domain